MPRSRRPAAAGARVVRFDASEAQLARDAALAARHGLAVETMQRDMADLGRFPAGSFDLV
ncbi:MAG TPA: methyltransferase domain-containing protein [Pseudomonadales bacterium]